MAVAKFPIKLGELNIYYNTAVPYLDTHKTRLGVSTSNITTLKNLHDDSVANNGWIQVFPLTQSRATSTGTLRDRRNNLRKDITAKLKEIYGDIPKSILTENDRNILHIFVRDLKPTARGPISTAPDVALTPQEGAKIKQRLRFDTDKNRASTHPLADGWERAVKIGGGPPATPSQCPIRETGTKALSTINAGMENDGERYYAFFRWVNFSNKENNSGWSPMKVVTISGGTVGTE